MKERPSTRMIKHRWAGRGGCGGAARSGGRRVRLGSRAAAIYDHMRLERHVGGAMRSDRVAARKQFPRVLKDNDAVAEQAPALLWVANYCACRLTIQCGSIWTGWRVRAHPRAS